MTHICPFLYCTHLYIYTRESVTMKNFQLLVISTVITSQLLLNNSVNLEVGFSNFEHYQEQIFDMATMKIDGQLNKLWSDCEVSWFFLKIIQLLFTDAWWLLDSPSLSFFFSNSWYYL